mmetsp:Transcript_30114/g.54933  ORF Transcript_30114/g.54933 Transcript_30114/m.54933 type:complete len:289 (-) Transcript_30114:103-969(-)
MSGRYRRRPSAERDRSSRAPRRKRDDDSDDSRASSDRAARRKRGRDRRDRSRSVDRPPPKESRRPAPKESSHALKASATKDLPAKKREKEFAWMDSGDEASGEEKGEEKKEREDSGDDLEDSGPTVPLAQVSTLSEMLRVVPKLKIGTMSNKDIMDALPAAARVRFYDANFFDKLLPELRSRLRSRPGGFASDELVESLASLKELNAYDEVLFSAVASALKDKLGELSPDKRRRLLAILKAVDHKKDGDLITTLVHKEKLETEAKQSVKANGDYLVTRSPGQLRPCRM